MSGWRDIDAVLIENGVTPRPPGPGQTTGGTHVSGSYHYSGHARDYSGTPAELQRIITVLFPMAAGPRAAIVELFGLSTFFKDGKAIAPSAKLRADHQNHVHAAVRPGTNLDIGGVQAGLNIPYISDAVEGIKDAADGVVDTATAVPRFLAGLVSRATFVRAMELVFGGLALIVGLLMLAKDLTFGGAVQTVKGSLP